VEALTGANREEQESLLERAVFPRQLAFDDGAWSSRAPWIELLHLLVKLGRPQQIVETGVQWGYSTATMLAAMPEEGRLDSIDLPNLDRRSRANHASAVPSSLRAHWTLHVGNTRTLLPRVVRARAPIGLAVHDADHTYEGLIAELRAVWPGLAPGALVAVDGVWSSALIDFAAEVGAPAPFLIERASESDALGVMRRPGGDS
jgi:predicted O-methyltransferase YrrM